MDALWSHFITVAQLLAVSTCAIGLWLTASNIWRCVRAACVGSFSWCKFREGELICLLFAAVLAVVVSSLLLFKYPLPITLQVVEKSERNYSGSPETSTSKEHAHESNRTRRYGPNEWFLFSLPISLSLIPFLFVWSRWRSVLDALVAVIIAIFALAFAAAGGLLLMPTSILILCAATLSRPIPLANGTAAL